MRYRGRDKLIQLNIQSLMWGFIIVGALFFLFPDGVVRVVNGWGQALGNFTAAPTTGFRLWLALGTGYMLLVTLLAWLIQRDLYGNRTLLLVLAAGKCWSSLTCLYYFLAVTDVFAYLLNFLLDGSITLMCLGMYKMLDPAQREKPVENPLRDGTPARKILSAVLRVLIPEEQQTLDARLTAHLVSMDARAPGLLVPALYAIEFGTLFWAGTTRRFTRLAPAEQERYLRSFAESRFYPRYMILFPIRFLASAVFYEDETVARCTGYEFPVLDRSAVGDY